MKGESEKHIKKKKVVLKNGVSISTWHKFVHQLSNSVLNVF